MLLSWKLTLAETLSFAGALVASTLWVTGTFVEKSSAKEFASSVEVRFSIQEARAARIDEKLNKIENDVTRIRTILEHRKQGD